MRAAVVGLALAWVLVSGYWAVYYNQPLLKCLLSIQRNCQ